MAISVSTCYHLSSNTTILNDTPTLMEFAEVRSAGTAQLSQAILKCPEESGQSTISRYSTPNMFPHKSISPQKSAHKEPQVSAMRPTQTSSMLPSAPQTRSLRPCHPYTAPHPSVQASSRQLAANSPVPALEPYESTPTIPPARTRPKDQHTKEQWM
jgi:hypothetical protein